MAFNPFHAFRKHQKVIFSMLTILCMFIFVFTWGVGDITSRFKGGKGQGEFVAKIYGTKVYASDLSQWKQRREMADTFMAILRSKALEVIANDPRGQTLAATEPNLKPVLRYLVMSDAELRTLSQEDQSKLGMGLQSLTLGLMQNDLKTKGASADERKFVDEVAEALKIKSSMQFGFFGTFSSNDEMLDFELWKHQADKLGIVLTHNAVRQVVQRDTAGRSVLPEGSFLANTQFRTSLAGFMQKFGGQYSESQILDALGDEYRVVMAQEALLGQAPIMYMGAGGLFSGSRDDMWLPAAYTPGEYMQYFREQRTTVKAALLPIQVEDLEKEVTATPMPAQVRKLYDSYKDKEPSPTKATPGFTEPRSVRVQYFTVKTDSEFYKKQSKNFVVASSLQMLIAPASSPMGGGAAVWTQTVGTPLALNPVLQQYGDYFKSFEPNSSGVVSGSKVAPDVYDPNYDAASVFGHLFGAASQGASLGGPAPLVAALTSTTRVHTQDRARAIGAMVMAGTSPTPGLGSNLAPLTNQVQPLDRIDAFIVEKARERAAQQQVLANLKALFKGIQDAHNDPADAEKFVSKAAKEDDFHLETMPSAKDLWQLADDPALKDLRDAFAKRKSPPITTPEKFAEEILKLRGTYSPDVVEESPLMDQWTVYWLVEDNAPKPRSFEAAKADVIAAWKRDEARKLARKKAEEIQDQLRNQSWPSDEATRQREVEAFLGKYGKPFVLNNMARMVEKDSVDPKTDKEYESYKPKESDIKYPPTNFADMVTGLQKVGDTTYVQNRPKTVVYVVVILARAEPTYDDFKLSYERVSQPGKRPDRLWNDFVAKERDDFRKNFIERMRTEAAPEQVADGKWVLPESLKGRSERAPQREEESEQ